MADEKSPDTKALATIERQNNLSVYSSAEAFEAAKAMATQLASSDMVPLAYKGKPQNCMVALEMAHRTGTSPLAVMQSLYMVHGKPSWSGQYIIAAINSCGRFRPLQFLVEDLGQKVVSGKNITDKRVTAWTETKNGDKIFGPPVSMEMAVLEGWYDKNPKWKSMPDLMLQYRAGTFFGRLHVPELLLGMQTQDELRDVTPGDANAAKKKNLNDRIAAKKNPVVDAEVIDVDASSEQTGGSVEQSEDERFI